MLRLISFVVCRVLILCAFSSCSSKYVVLNKGVGGNTSSDLLRRIDKDVIAENPDLVILMVGTNDMVNSRKFIDYEKFKANYSAIIRKLESKKIDLLLMIPPPVDTGYLFKRHRASSFSEDPNEKIQKAGEIVRSLASENGFEIIDLNTLFKTKGEPSREIHSLLLNLINSGREDGIHPTSQGYKLIAEEVFGKMKERGLRRRCKKVVCFGDSMTYGSFMPGAGTAEGETYPSYLNQLLNKKTKL